METLYEAEVENYLDHLKYEERSKSTRSQYQRDILCFLSFLGADPLTKENAVAYKQKLEQDYQPTTTNTKLSALNSFFEFLGRSDLRLKLLKIQKKVYCSAEKELNKKEYVQLVKTAKREKKQKLALLMQTICSTGIRVSEVKYITAEAVYQGEAVIQLKGKTRMILLPRKLQKDLKDYLRIQKITSGPVFVTRTGRPLDRSNIWKMMKNLCQEAGVAEGKVFPHNLRHLFARCFYAIEKDIAKLADILGHSSINTTRIYIITSGKEHRRLLDALDLVS